MTHDFITENKDKQFLRNKMAQTQSDVKEDELAGTILHVVVVGFHHKKGCQVDFSYPPLIEGAPGDSQECPPEWKHLPFLALPDGAHNFEEDTIYFHLPGRGEDTSTIYGVSCYRQIKAQDLISKDADVTRGTVQKCVCVLSKLPLYGLIQAKLELITHAYFCERDFSKTKILHEFYNSLNSSIPRSLPSDSQVFLGLSLRDLVLTFKHKILVLFKLMLLERRVLFFTSPVHRLCNTLLAIASLFPGMIERGLKEAACPKHYNPRISTIELQDYGIDTEEYLDINQSHVPNYQRRGRTGSSDSNPEKKARRPSDGSEENSRLPLRNPNKIANKDEGETSGETWGSNGVAGSKATSAHSSRTGSMDKENIPGGGSRKDSTSRKTSRTSSQGSMDSNCNSSRELAREQSIEEELIDMIDKELYGDYFADKKSSDNCEVTPNADSLDKRKDSVGSSNTRDALGDPKTKSRLHQHSASIQSGDSGIDSSHRSSTMSSEQSQGLEDTVTRMRNDTISEMDDYVVLPNTPRYEPMDVDDYGFPLAIFGKGALCHPYMSLQQHDLLQDVNVRSFVIGATNALFKHHKHLMDVIIEVEEGKVNILDAELKKQLSLSTADLRFADFLIKNVSDRNNDVFLDGTGWEGGDEWIRAQFKVYLLSLLSTCTSTGTFLAQEIGDFNDGFIQAWKTTHNFRMWTSTTHKGIDKIHTGHPFHRQLSMNDMKIRLTSVMQTTERGKKINSAINRTGVAMMQTGKVVGDVLTSAKSAVSSWLYGLATEWKEEGEEDKENKEDKEEETK